MTLLKGLSHVCFNMNPSAAPSISWVSRELEIPIPFIVDKFEAVFHSVFGNGNASSNSAKCYCSKRFLNDIARPENYHLCSMQKYSNSVCNTFSAKNSPTEKENSLL